MPKDDHPIIDIHSHAFNARYVPMRRVIKARMWVDSPYKPLILLANGLGILDAAAALLATSTPWTEDQRRQQWAAVRAYLAKRGMDEKNDAHLFEAITHTPAVQPRLVWNTDSTSRGNPEDLGPFAWLSHRVIGNETLVRLAANAFVDEPVGIASFGVSFMSHESDLLKRMQRLQPGVDLFVYENMDLVPSFYHGIQTQAYSYSSERPVSQERKDGDPEKSAVMRIRKLRAESKGKMITFVAWNPFRSMNEAKVKSLEIVKREIAKGASGVKFYPPFGYRPSGNDFSKFKRPFFLSEAREQWVNRYLGNHPKGNEAAIMAARAKQLDALNEELFSWCAKEQIPIFTHCNDGEFRAFDSEEYGDCANPEYWRPVLVKHPRLKLCFGHAGGTADWYGEHGPREEKVPGSRKWGAIVRELCLTYPNVYCEFGIHEEVTDPIHAENIYRSLLKFLPMRGKGGWALGEKVMYGSDFFMPAQVSWAGYLAGFQKLFSLRGLTQYKSKFFAGNALDYLNGKGRPRITVSNRFR